MDDVKMNRMHHTDFLDAPHGRGVLVWLALDITV